MAAGAKVAHPAFDKRRFRWTALARRSTDIQNHGAILTQSNPQAEGPTTQGRLTSEPVVEHLRSRDDYALRIHAVKPGRFAPLCLVPDEHLLRRIRQDAFAREMIPAGDRKHISNPELGRCASKIELRRLQDDEWREHDNIGLLLAQISMEGGGRSRRLLE